MRILIATIAILLISVMFTGCGTCPKPEVRTVYKTIYKTKEVLVPVKCDLPKPKCSFKSKGFTPAVKLLECVTTQKKFIEACAK